MNKVLDYVLLRVFIRLGRLWFPNILMSTDTKTGRTVSMVFSTKYSTVHKVCSWMTEKDIT